MAMTEPVRRGARRRSIASIGAIASAAFLALAMPQAGAVEPDEMLPDPTLEARARALSSELRCLVCQNQSIDDSNAPLARDLRLLVRERLKVGDSDTAVRQFLVARYGDFVLLRPPFRVSTLLLWLGPPALLLGTLGLLLVRWRRDRGAHRTADARLTAEEEARLAALVDKKTLVDRKKT